MGAQLPSPHLIIKLDSGHGGFAALSPQQCLLVSIAMIKVTMDFSLNNFA